MKNSTKNFISGIIDTPNHPDFDGIYDCYSKVFTLPSERESRENFEEILASNMDPEVSASKAKEMWIYMKNEEGRVIGAANFDVFAGSKTKGVDGTIHAIYVFVDPEFRQQGIFTALNDKMHEAACNFIKESNGSISEKPNIPIIAEQNSPFMMTAEEYKADNNAAGIDQVVRRAVFEKEGYRTLACRYIQPALSDEQGACHYLDLVAKVGSDINKIPNSVVEEHVDRFFSLSFPEGTSRHHPDLIEMKSSMSSQPNIALHPAGRFSTLAKYLHPERIADLPEDKLNTPLGDVLPNMKAAFESGRLIGGKDIKHGTHQSSLSNSNGSKNIRSS